LGPKTNYLDRIKTGQGKLSREFSQEETTGLQTRLIHHNGFKPKVRKAPTELALWINPFQILGTRPF